MKRPERLTLLDRVRKGDPLISFKREQAAIRCLQSENLPVAKLIYEGPDILVTKDGGTPVSALVADPRIADEEVR